MTRFAMTAPFAATAFLAASCQLVAPTIVASPSPSAGPVSPSPTASPAARPSGSPSGSPTPMRTPDAQQVDVCGDITESDFPVTATAATASAPALTTKHTENRVTLATVGSAKGGFVKFNSDKEGPWDIFLTRNVAFKLITATGSVVTPSASASSFPDCAALAAKYTVDLKLGVHYIELGPTSESEVSIVTESGEED